MKLLLIKHIVKRLTNNKDINNLIYIIYQKCYITYIIDEFISVHNSTRYIYIKMDVAIIGSFEVIRCVDVSAIAYCWLCKSIGMKGMILQQSEWYFNPAICYNCL